MAHPPAFPRAFPVGRSARLGPCGVGSAPPAPGRPLHRASTAATCHGRGARIPCRPAPWAGRLCLGYALPRAARRGVGCATRGRAGVLRPAPPSPPAAPPRARRQGGCRAPGARPSRLGSGPRPCRGGIDQDHGFPHAGSPARQAGPVRPAVPHRDRIPAHRQAASHRPVVGRESVGEGREPGEGEREGQITTSWRMHRNRPSGPATWAASVRAPGRA